MKIQLKFGCWFGLCLLVRTVFAQDPQFSQYYSAPLYLNPALAGINQKGSIGMNYRSQWPNIEGNYETFSVFASNHFEDYYSSIGFLVTTDQVGTVGLRSTSVAIQYAYQLSLTSIWTFRPGLEVAYHQRDINLHKLLFGDQLNNTGVISNQSMETFNNGLKANFVDISLGGIFYSPSIWIGGAVDHVAEPNQSLSNATVPLQRHISIHGGIRVPLNKNRTRVSGEKSITPSFNYRLQGDFDQLDIGTFFTLNQILVGFWYRGLPIKLVENTVNHDAIVLMFGFQGKRLTIGYSFDYTISELGLATGGAHEISIAHSIDFTPRKPAAHIRDLKCPVPFLN